MRIARITKITSIASVFVALATGSLASFVLAGDVQFTAEVDRHEISQDESVSLKFSLKIDGNVTDVEPSFNAPDFDMVNEFNSTFIESYYENGRFGMRNNRQITKVLRPTHSGALMINDISVKVDGKVYHGSPITVRVSPAGSGTPPPQRYGGSGIGLRGAAKRANATGFIVRAEVSKDKVYKGEQVIVSYYLYRRSRVFNIQVDKYPVLSGFLREDLEMPVLSPRLDFEPVVLDGVAYERALLARYAAYPLKDGKLRIDSMAVKANYYAAPAGAQNDDDDPFFNFFQQLAPKVSTQQSESVTVDVMPLPTEGRPASFTGGVGDFTVTSAVDKYEVHANEPVTLTVKVEGEGNVSAVEEPKAKWPDSVELYDSKGRAKSGKAGVGEKIFEFLLIPRSPGTVKLPPLEFAFFDPVKRQYVTRSTDPIQIQVTDPVPGSVVTNPVRSKAPQGVPTSSATSATADIHYLKPPQDGVITTGNQEFRGQPWWRWLYWLTSASLLVFLGLVGSDWLKKSRAYAKANREARGKLASKDWRRLQSIAQNANQTGAHSWQEILQAYESLSELVLDALERSFAVSVRSFSRTDLERILVEEQGLSSELWSRISQLLEFTETVRFASSAGAISETAARSDLERWVKEGEAIESQLRNIPTK